jgi:hypothetical protein
VRKAGFVLHLDNHHNCSNNNVHYESNLALLPDNSVLNSHGWSGTSSADHHSLPLVCGRRVGLDMGYDLRANANIRNAFIKG